MQQFVVPQFIDVEGKIIGPITTRQFVMMLVGGLLIFVTFRFASFSVFVFTSVFVVFFVIVFGFVKVNSMPIFNFLLNVVKMSFGRPLLRAWMREVTAVQLTSITDTTNKAPTDEIKDSEKLKPLPRTRLSELSLVVDTGGVYNDTDIIT